LVPWVSGACVVQPVVAGTDDDPAGAKPRNG
jgi:hypothetical protein